MNVEMMGMVDQLWQLATRYALGVFGAVVLLIVGWIFAGWAERRVRGALKRSQRVDITLQPIMASVVRYTILVLVFVAVLAQFGVQTASIIAVLGAAGLAIGLALQGALSNVAAGVLLLFLRPLKVGEYIDAGGVSGTVTEIGLFATELATFDGVFVAVPNSQLTAAAIKNYSRLPTRRIDVAVGIGYDDDIERAMGALSDLLAADPRVLPEPAHQVMVMTLGDNAVELNVRCWTKREDYWGLLFDLNKRAKQRLEQEGCSIPFPQRTVHLVPQPERSA